ncbi:MAG: hypothetical protein ACRC01_09980, partial [Deefgea sp.]
MQYYSLRGFLTFVVGALLVAAAQAAPLERAEALRVLGRAASAAEMVSYAGNYVYQYGDHVANYQ